jgi:LPXTG-site transpeptidase (sortase) family protein
MRHHRVLLASLLIGLWLMVGGQPVLATMPRPPSTTHDLFLSQTESASSAAGNAADKMLPVRLKIPVIGVDAAVESVGLTEKGLMGIPTAPNDVAWYNGGVTPGEQGNAVISGHLDDRKGPAVFWRLDKLKVGDQVIVVDAGGKEHTFAVLGSEVYQVDKAPLNKIFGFDLERDLNLITCKGKWDRKVRGYNQRLVVYTRLVDK